jgi:hypothetical protein
MALGTWEVGLGTDGYCVVVWLLTHQSVWRNVDQCG